MSLQNLFYQWSRVSDGVIGASPSFAAGEPNALETNTCNTARHASASNAAAGAFSLVELLVVIAIISVMSAASGPALQSVWATGSNSRSINDLSQTLELARSYAMAHNTYVRLGFSPLSTGVMGRTTPGVLVVAMYPANGVVDSTNNTAQSLADPNCWRLVAKPVVLNNLVCNNALNAKTPSTANDVYPGDSSSGTSQFPVFQRAGFPAANFTASVQVAPSGELQVASDGTPARYIKMPFDRPAPQNGKNPFILRINGINGNIDVLLKENEIQ